MFGLRYYKKADTIADSKYLGEGHGRTALKSARRSTLRAEAFADLRAIQVPSQKCLLRSAAYYPPALARGSDYFCRFAAEPRTERENSREGPQQGQHGCDSAGLHG